MVKLGFERGARRARESMDAEAVAIRGLAFLAGRPEPLERFLAATGLDPGDLRGAAASPGFLAAVLEAIVGDEPVLIAFAQDLGADPEAVVAAQARLAGAPPASG